MSNVKSQNRGIGIGIIYLQNIETTKPAKNVRKQSIVLS